MSSLVNDNIDLLDKHILSTFEQIFEKKIQNIDQGLKSKLRKYHLINNFRLHLHHLMYLHLKPM